MGHRPIFCVEVFLQYMDRKRRNERHIHISELLKMLIVIYFALFNFGSIFNMFIMEVGKLKIQMWTLDNWRYYICSNIYLIHKSLSLGNSKVLL